MIPKKLRQSNNRQIMTALLDILLVALIVFGVILRFSWNNWNQGTSLHPDEYGLTNTLTQLQMPENTADYFNTRISPISAYHKYDEMGNHIANGPDNRMRWGQWPIIIIRQFAEWTGNTGYDELRLMGRQLSATADVLAIFLIFLIGSRLYNERVGLLAAALSALAVMQVQQSHFMTSDNFAVFFTALAMLAATMVATSRSRSHYAAILWYVLFGVALGMTVASRINLAPLAGLIVVAALIAISRREGIAVPGLLPAVLRVMPLLVLAALVALGTFRLTQPMTFRAPAGRHDALHAAPQPGLAGQHGSGAERIARHWGRSARRAVGRSHATRISVDEYGGVGHGAGAGAGRLGRIPVGAGAFVQHTRRMAHAPAAAGLGGRLFPVHGHAARDVDALFPAHLSLPGPVRSLGAARVDPAVAGGRTGCQSQALRDGRAGTGAAVQHGMGVGFCLGGLPPGEYPHPGLALDVPQYRCRGEPDHRNTAG
jgi:hypothetical protein